MTPCVRPAVWLWPQPMQAGTLRLLPTSLVELVALLDTDRAAGYQQVDLGHLTALTRLYLVNRTRTAYLGKGHVLPPGLQALTLMGPYSWSLLGEDRKSVV